MGIGGSAPTLPPATLKEITSNAMDGEMLFEDGIATTIDPKNANIINQNFQIERRRHIQRFKLEEDGRKSVVLSYSKDEAEYVKNKLQELGLSTDIFFIKLPCWCPRNIEQKNQAHQFWPMNNVIDQALPEKVNYEDHQMYLAQVYNEKCILIAKPDTTLVVAKAKSDCLDCDCCFEHGVIDAVAQASQWAIQNDSYLCTNLDVYCYYEPCCMCTMAMVHSRVGRLFFIEPNPKYGGVMSQAHINLSPKINHRFRAFRMIIGNSQ